MHLNGRIGLHKKTKTVHQINFEIKNRRISIKFVLVKYSHTFIFRINVKYE